MYYVRIWFMVAYLPTDKPGNTTRQSMIHFIFQTAKSTAMELKQHFPHVQIEVSGGITHETLSEYFSPHVDILSMSRLTQGYNCVDFSMKIKKEGHDPNNPTVKRAKP